MAPCKTATTAEPTKMSRANSSDKVVKRPARGYHKYKNGLLNVTPKGGEVELVRNNQNSPLLRLPPEIRNCIWEYALGHNIFRAYVPGHRRRSKSKWTSLRDVPGISVALLRSCRQIYSEAAIMPFRLNVMAYQTLWELKKTMKQFKLYQREQISTIRIEATSVRDWSVNRISADIDDFMATLPGVKHIQLAVFAVASPGDPCMLDVIEAQLRQHLSENHNVCLTVERHDSQMPCSYYDWIH